MITMKLRVATLHPDKIDEYERLHNEIPEMNIKHIREAGYAKLQIFRQGLQLMMYLEWDSTTEIPDRFVDEEVEAAWHRLTEPCFSRTWEEVPMIFSLDQPRINGYVVF
ncbi:L-rhamnose mutarotase [Paenibacillus psychroresistens]|uniref:L-rhamnose mutarotase n=1 Tax=Paenibacillus psychroresistens TaxID=1778678 RepID=A0A6B8RGP2_9BACL|nr:L-rhamnose mutarotase [Paenibacillus psychroresistens]QGQ94568.1 L-rhamnose mutarotase [Paenibacillus psychroresistens]